MRLQLEPAIQRRSFLVRARRRWWTTAEKLRIVEETSERLFEIAAGMDTPHGFVDTGQLNYALLREGVTPDEHRAGIEK